MKIKAEKDKEALFSNRFGDCNEETSLNDDQDKELANYNNLKEQLKYNLKDDINNKIQRMKILYEIKQKELYKYDGFARFNDFIKSFEVAKSQAYRYLKIYQKVLEGKVSIDKIKEVGFKAILRDIKAENFLNEDNHSESEGYNESIPIRILVKDKELYNFCKQDTKRLYFIIEKIYKEKRDVLSELIIEYEKNKK
ncbi:chromosome replication/partitioning protein [Borreliella burgdorferi]|uniref:chromosome replication/partitioning protein n=1 Tax=Borreliella burgdorferi TaxID=139 RepID=UPI00017F4752|nr:chromosome replication/partitioning protein [Borreliella burgdorferi]ACO38198.1 putative plasmid partition protein [Borreliella burgdorferi 29805]MCD2373166.1 chromosome replication/partitioning protein [Borreliella burgdorferi]MCD2376785.1 chromosome replication/partitioning protein [Borreliella burgdorferi]MCD2377969.1 chromosome replication/partitioning protein [Borreliella burgdorferi]MCD2388603.1 chromosome replication/partitioning protein [Borreliella burgdorferi]